MRTRRQSLVLLAVLALIALGAGLVRGGGHAKAQAQPMLIVAGAGAGGGPHVRVWKFDPDQNILSEVGGFMAFSPAFGGGVHVAAADIDGDKKDEIIAGAGPTGGPQVVAYKSVPPGAASTSTSFYAYS